MIILKPPDFLGTTPIELITKSGNGGVEKGPIDQPDSSSLWMVALITSGLSNADLILGVRPAAREPLKPISTPVRSALQIS